MLYINIIGKYVKKIQDSLKSDKNNGYSTWTPIYIYNTSHSSSKNKKRFKKVIDKIKAHI
jgi:hypothetical protein